jgi:hypothetical protein
MLIVYLLLQFIVQPPKPGCSIFVVERDPVLHLFDVGRRMEIVRVQKEPTQFLRHLHSDRRLPGTGDTHENHCLRLVVLHTMDRVRPPRGILTEPQVSPQDLIQ